MKWSPTSNRPAWTSSYYQKPSTFIQWKNVAKISYLRLPNSNPFCKNSTRAQSQMKHIFNTSAGLISLPLRLFLCAAAANRYLYRPSLFPAQGQGGGKSLSPTTQRERSVDKTPHHGRRQSKPHVSLDCGRKSELPEGNQGGDGKPNRKAFNPCSSSGEVTLHHSASPTQCRLGRTGLTHNRTSRRALKPLLFLPVCPPVLVQMVRTDQHTAACPASEPAVEVAPIWVKIGAVMAKLGAQVSISTLRAPSAFCT